MFRYLFMAAFFGFLTATCALHKPTSVPTDQLHILIQNDTVRHFAGDTLNLELTLSNVSDSVLAVIPGGGAFTVWTCPDSFVTDMDQMYCGRGMSGLGDTLHLQAGEEIVLNVAFVYCGELEPFDTAEYFVKYHLGFDPELKIEDVRSYSSNCVVIISR